MINVWLGHLGAYNAGYLVGRWVELPKDKDELNEIIDELKKEAEKVGEYGDEFDVFDYETEVNSIYNQLEYMSLSKLNELAAHLDAMDEYELAEFEIIAQITNTVDEALEAMDNKDYIILAEVNNLDDLGRIYVEDFDGINIPKHLEPYIDYEKLGRELIHDGWNVIEEYEVAVWLQ